MRTIDNLSQMALFAAGIIGFSALGAVLLLYTDAPPVVGWACILFFGLGGVWTIARHAYLRATRQAPTVLVDVDLPLTELSQNSAGEYHVTALANFDGRLVGLSIVVGSHWESRPSTGFTLYSGAVLLRAIDVAGDGFVDFLAARYETPLSMARMLSEVAAHAVGLDSDPRELALRATTMKLFFHPEIDDRYAELFLHIDLAKRLVQFREKDPAYRSNVLRALTEMVR